MREPLRGGRGGLRGLRSTGSEWQSPPEGLLWRQPEPCSTPVDPWEAQAGCGPAVGTGLAACPSVEGSLRRPSGPSWTTQPGVGGQCSR